MIKTVLFDLGNTLYKNEEFDSQYPRLLSMLLAKDREITLEEAEETISETAKELKKKSSEHVTKVAMMEALGYTRTEVHDEFCKNNPKDFVKEDRQLVKMLARLSEEYRLGIVSNFRRSHTVEIIQALGLEPLLFEVIIGEDNVINIKPDPEGFLTALWATRSQPDEVVYVADSITKDLIPAKSVGLHTIQIGGDQQPDQSVDLHIDKIYKLPEAIKHL
ncbi:MAG: HAD family hydrolase [Candidatus Altiarchaeota archaeon]